MQRELLLVKVRADRPARSQVLETVELFRARVVDVAPDTLTIEATGTPDKLDALLRDLEPYGIKEMVQSGTGGDRPRLALDHRRPRAARRLTAPARPVIATGHDGPTSRRTKGKSMSVEVFYDDDADLSA